MKKHRLLSLLTVAAMVAALVVLAIPAASAEAVVWNGKSGTSIAAGSGTADDPYLIKDPGELDMIEAPAAIPQTLLPSAFSGITTFAPFPL